MNARTGYQIALSALTFVAIATATAPAAENSNDRFMMSPVDGGFLRLDKQTGAVSMCAHTGSAWACTPVEDHTPVGAPKDFSRLEQENRELKDRVRSLEETLETAKPLPPGNPPDGKLQLPTDQEVDQALDYLERVYKKVRDRVKDMDKPAALPEGAPPPPTPDNTPAPPPPKGAL